MARAGALAALLVAAEAEIRGVAPAEQAQYAAATFACDGRQLPSEAVNDDFCDCEDGSDEPGTEACAGFSSTLYYCTNEQSDPLYIYASRVNDGVCDCCDGSDEWQAERRQITCPNTCAEEGRALRKERSRQIADLHAGIKQRESLISTAKADRLKAEGELRKLQAQLPDLEGAAQEATAQLEEAKRAVAAEAAAQTAANATEDNASAAPAPADEVQEAFESQVKAKEAEAKEAEAKPVVSEYSKWMDGAEKVLEEASEAKPEVSEYSKWMDGAEKVLAEADDFDEVLKDAPDFPDDDNEPASPASSPSPSASRSAGLGFWEQVKRKWGEKWRNFRNWAFGSRSPAERALDKAENRQEAAQKELKTARVRVEELEKKLKSTTEEWELPYSGLDGRCIEKSIGEYKYKICFFDDAKQDSTSIGRWKGWDAPGLAAFDAGQYCPGGPERSLKVKFQCGSKEELLDVSEPSRCTYEAQLKHPAACTAKLLRALEAAGPRRPLDEL